MKKTAAALILSLLFLILVGCARGEVSPADTENEVPVSAAPADETPLPDGGETDSVDETDAEPASDGTVLSSDNSGTDAAPADTEPETESTSEENTAPQASQPPSAYPPAPEQTVSPAPEPEQEPFPEQTEPPAEREEPSAAPPQEPSAPSAEEAPIPPAAEPEPAPEATAPPPPQTDDTPSQTSGYVAFNGIDEGSPAVLQVTEDMGQDYIDRIVFLGDSTTYGLKAYSMLTDGRNTKQVWTPTSGTLTLSYQSFADIWYPDDGTEITIREAAAKKQPEYMIITLGVNGVSFMDEDYFKAEYTDLVTGIQQASPDTKIILQSIFPVASNYEYQGSINNEKINAANKWVLEVAESTGVRFLNTCTVLIGSDGYMVSSYQNGDGLHLNGTGFGLVLDYIRTHAYP